MAGISRSARLYAILLLAGFVVLPSPASADGALVITMKAPSHKRAATIEPLTPAVITVGRTDAIVGEPVRFSRTLFSATPEVEASALPRISLPPSGLPVSGILTSGFGLRTHPLLGFVREHSGVDLAAPMGTPIAATSDGVVTQASWAGGYGLLVGISDGAGTQTRFGHMSRLNVREGQTVRKGDLIGYVGSTGLSTGPHVHYEVRRNGRAINPLDGPSKR